MHDDTYRSCLPHGEVAITTWRAARGQAFVVLHGGATRWQYGRNYSEALATDRHVFAPDFRGYGRSVRVPIG
jgi:pimeloyl-ACP methyl ester carboxylesterase